MPLGFLTPCVEPVKAFYSSHRTLCRGIVIAYAGFTFLKWMTKTVKRRQREKREEGYPRDTVILHMPGRGPFVPSIIPFAVKVETYLRMAKIPYQNEYKIEKSSKQKFPWITYNGEEVADSAFCLELLNTQCTVDLSSWLTPEQRATAMAFQRLVEDNLYWVLVCTRFAIEVDTDLVQATFGWLPLGALFFRLVVRPRLRRQVWAQGMGRHSQQEIRHIARCDFAALSDFLGKKQFLMGDRPCEQDCAVFGILSQFMWQLPGPTGDIFKEFPVLVAYCERMKDQFWPDWLQCTTQGGTVPSTA